MNDTGQGTDLFVDIHPKHAGDLCVEHDALALEIEQLRILAGALALRPVSAIQGDIERAWRLVADRAVPHIREEHEHHMHLALRDGRPLPPRNDETEIERLAGRLDELGPVVRSGAPDAVRALRAVLFDLHTLLHLHFAGGC